MNTWTRVAFALALGCLSTGCGMLVRAETGAMTVGDGPTEPGAQGTVGFTGVSVKGFHVTPSVGGYATQTTGGLLFNVELGVVAGGVRDRRKSRTRGVGGGAGVGLTGAFGRIHYGFGRRGSGQSLSLSRMGWSHLWNYFDISLMAQKGLENKFARDAVLGGIAWHMLLHN